MLHHDFNSFHLSQPTLKAIADLGFTIPTPIQDQAIDPILAGKDIVGQAQTGTGKTAAFGIPMVERVDREKRFVQALVLCPTRELAVQLTGDLTLLARYHVGLRIAALYGGQPIERQIQALKKGAQVVIGTPGRLLDHLERRTLRLDGVRISVLDEADKMLDMGFIDDVRAILARMPEGRQTLLFSATMPKPVLDLSRTFQMEPERINVSTDELTVPEVEQAYFEVDKHQRVEVLGRLIAAHGWKMVLVFCNTKRMVDELAKRMHSLGHDAGTLHGDMRQSKRDGVMAQFRSGRLPILIATDVAARGIDIDGIEAVVNFDVPRDEEQYVHRIGRTARAGRSGRAYTFVSGWEQSQLAAIQEFARTTIHWQPLPGKGQKSASHPQI